MHTRGHFATAALALNTVLLPTRALAQTDVVPAGPVTNSVASPLVSGRAAAAAGLLFAATLLGDRGLREEIQELRGTTTNSIAKLGNGFGEPRYVVPVLAAGYLAGQLAGSRPLKRVMLRAGAAAAVAGGATTVLKYVIGRARPTVAGDPDQFRPFTRWNSFPSGHSAVAFAIATTIAEQTPDSWSDVALYGAATVTTFARVNDDRHWTSDVLVGAFIGHLSARWVARRLGPLSVRPGGVAASFDF